jgi:signal transduction histidine kinase
MTARCLYRASVASVAIGARRLWRRAVAPLRGSDLVLVAAVAALGQLEVWAPAVSIAHIVGPPWVNALGYLLAAMALLWRRQAPVAVLAAVASISSVQYLLIGASQGLGSFLPPLVAVYSVGRHAHPRALLVAGPLTLLAVAIHELRDPIFELGGATVTFWAILAVGWVVGHLFRRRAREVEALAAHAERVEREREERTRQAITEERLRITRELHDVVGHAVSLTVLQVVAALELLDAGRAEAARPRLLAVERVAREALAEMRRLVAVLGPPGEAIAAPQPHAAAIQQLVDDAVAAGLEVELAVEGEARALPPGTDLAAYRIVQEALTNVRRHAGPARASVTLRYARDALEIQVADDGRGATHRADGGRGLIGMRERVALYGGQLTTGSRAEGGYLIEARLPLEATE